MTVSLIILLFDKKSRTCGQFSVWFRDHHQKGLLNCLTFLLVIATIIIAMKICPFCEEHCKDDDLFCRYCGHDISNLPLSLERKKLILDNAISKYQSKGWILIENTGLKAQVEQYPQLNVDYSIWEIRSILFLAVMRWIDYAYHWGERVTLSVDDKGHLHVKSNRDVRFILLALLLITITCFTLIFYSLIRA